MQKKIIALAVAGLMSGAAFAQSNVTVYGEVDLGYLHGVSDTAAGAADTKSGIQSGVWASSRLGFKGEEALGNGLKAIFTLEYALTADANSAVGAGTSPAREQTLGLAGDFGLVKAGRMTSLGHAAVNKFDPMRATAFAPLSSIRATSISNSSRVDNTIVYVSPVMAGFTVAATYGFGGTPGAADDTTAYNGNDTTLGTVKKQQRVIGFMADFTSGPFAMAYVHHHIGDLGNTAVSATVSDVNNKENFIGGSYDFGVLKLLASYQTESNNNVLASKLNRRITSLGAQVPVTATSRVDVGYARLNDRFSNSDTMTVDQDARSWGVQYSYDLSKRTMAFAGYQHLSNNDGGALAALGTTNGVAPTTATAGVGGLNSTGYGFGMRHKF